MLAIRGAAHHKGHLNAGFWVLKKPYVFRCAIGYADVERDVSAGKFFPILLSKELIGSAFGSGCDCNGRRRRGIEIRQAELYCAGKTYDRDEGSEQRWMPIDVAE